ncbi:hypothetical protein GYMLUDRAFT_251279 [Collybiopsis luxurians FD-317 M1]|uniref:Uncharacterized protein n=1 Tax=Collybiopsis luxurians FD-317 M1 TaxID=944289 RepID=A0A0D0BRS5_9AGAR|nr:hypothetical protein GYMLUDRAFT_251279 [Collybiopsis luxurians FD-317 M1]
MAVVEHSDFPSLEQGAMQLELPSIMPELSDKDPSASNDVVLRSTLSNKVRNAEVYPQATSISSISGNWKRVRTLEALRRVSPGVVTVRTLKTNDPFEGPMHSDAHIVI